MSSDQANSAAASNTASSCVNKTKLIPTLSNEGNYQNWKEDIKIWAKICGIPKSEQALHIHLSLNGRARTASSEIGIDALNKDSGIESLIAKLDELFLPEKERRQFSAFNSLYTLRRDENKSVKSFIADFEHQYFKFQQEDMTLPDAVVAYMLLSSCSLTPSNVHLVMSALNKVTYESMKAIIMRVFGSEVKQNTEISDCNSSLEIKTEPTFPVENSHESFYSATRSVSRGGYRGRYNRSNGGRNRSRNNSNRGGAVKDKRSNPLDNNGNISRCNICESKFHWAAHCPHAYERNQNEETEFVQLSMFVGFAEGQLDNEKLNNLVSDSENCALLDTGCSKTVCGTQWLSKYLGSLSDYQLGKVKEEKSESRFTFGDSRTFQSLKRVTIPCNIGGLSVEITTDVVECQIPLLLSVTSLQKAKAVWYFGDYALQISGKKVSLGRTKSGHSLLPLSF